ncbi:MAG: S8 family peptidase [Anaerolineales bacterium]
MRKSKFFMNMVFMLMLVLTALGNPSMVAQAGNGNDELKADPRLLQLADEHPDFVFPVIVQKNLRNKDLPGDDPERAVEKTKGKVNRGKKMNFIAGFSADLTGKEIEKLARNPKVRWISLDAPLFSTTAGGETVRDEFTARSYGGNNGAVNWSGNWTEVGEYTDPANGIITVNESSRCAGGTRYCLRLDPNPNKPTGTYIYRQMDLSGVAWATLSFYRSNELNSAVNGIPGSTEEVKVQISADGGANWATLRTYSSVEFIGADTDTFNVTAYASNATLIRFILTRQQWSQRFLYIDDVTIEYARASDFRSAVHADQLALDGQGVTVAVIDSGINPHADLQVSASGGSRVLTDVSMMPSTTPADGYGHGAHVAGIIGGNGTMSNGTHMGMAPMVNLINVKVSNDVGMSLGSDLIAGLQWVYDNRVTYNIKVVNISVNSSVAESYHTSPIDAAVELLWFNGIVVVVSAGNSGAGTLYPPANDPFVITVGAIDEMGTPSLSDDVVASFSAYGITEDGFTKPDLVAPGRNVISLLASTNATAYIHHPDFRVDNYYFRMSGTSMSAPVVSGAVALLLQDEPNLNPDQVKYRLMATANAGWMCAATGMTCAGPIELNGSPAGAGYLDVYAAVHGTTTESANAGTLPSQMLSTGSDPITWGSVGWNSAGWNSVGWNSVGWNSVGWNSVGWNSVGWNSVGWNSDYWGP